MPDRLAIRCVGENTRRRYFLVPAGKQGGPPVTVSLGQERITLCHGCRVVDCVHARELVTWLRGHPGACVAHPFGTEGAAAGVPHA